MRQVMKMISPKEKQFKEMLDDPELQPILEDKIIQLLSSRKVDDFLVNFFLTQLSETKLNQRMALQEQFTGLNVNSHCIGEDWEWEDMSSEERVGYQRKVVVMPLSEQLALLDDRVNNASIPCMDVQPPISLMDRRVKIVYKALLTARSVPAGRILSSAEIYNLLSSGEVPDESRVTGSRESSKSTVLRIMDAVISAYPQKVRRNARNEGNKKASLILIE